MPSIITEGYGVNQKILILGLELSVEALFDICRIYEYVYYADNLPRPGSVGYATIIELPYDYNDALFTNPTDFGARAISNLAGYIYWDIVWGAKVAFQIDDAGKAITAIIPKVDSIRLSDLTEAL